MLLQNFAPFVLFLPQRVYAAEPLSTQINFDNSANFFQIGLNTKENDLTSGKVSYTLLYKNESAATENQIEAVKGSVDLTSDDFSKIIDAKTCSTNETCINHNVKQGILKVKIDENNWFNNKKFLVNSGNVTVSSESDKGNLDELSDSDRLWLETGKEEVAPTVVPTAMPEVTPTIDDRILDGISTQITPTETVAPPVVTPEITESPAIAETPTIIEPEISYVAPSLMPLTWTTLLTQSTIDKVELSKTYVAPQNSEVKVTFTKLPTNPGNLKIEEITLTAEQVAVIGALSNKAYDITSDMEDGTFAYDLSLPIPDSAKGQNVEIKFAENVAGLNNAETVPTNETEVTNEEVKANLDHFTVFIISANKTVTSSSISGSRAWTNTTGANTASDGSYASSSGITNTSSSQLLEVQ
jgi:hypothetical protein